MTEISSDIIADINVLKFRIQILRTTLEEIARLTDTREESCVNRIAKNELKETEDS